MTYVPVKCECGCVFLSATSHCPNCNAPVKPQARPIDANALLAKLEDCRGDKEDVDVDDAHDVAYYSAMSRAIRFAKDAPTLDYAPVMRGEWIKQKNGRLICSVCGVRGLQDSDELDYYYYPSGYCPNCGARMDAKEDER